MLPLELVLVYLATGELRRAGNLGTGCCLDATKQVVLVVLGLLVLGLLMLGLLLACCWGCCCCGCSGVAFLLLPERQAEVHARPPT